MIRRIAILFWLATAVPVVALPTSQKAVVISQMAFGPAPADLAVGDRLTFRNADLFQHSATVIGEFDLDLKPGASKTVTLKHAGTFEVICRYHPTMKVRIVVQSSHPKLRQTGS